MTEWIDGKPVMWNEALSTRPWPYDSKPVQIRAMLYDGTAESMASLARWLGDHLGTDGESAVIYTLEGTMTISVGDWVIQGTRGEFYPCKPDVFETKYARFRPGLQ